MNKNKIALALTLVGVIIFILAIVFTPSKKDDFLSRLGIEEESNEFFDYSSKTASSFGNKGEDNLWKTVGEEFVASIPHEWEIQQHDAGTGFVVYIFDTKKPEDKISFWFYHSDETDKVGKIGFEDWITLITTSLSGLEKCDSRNIGGYKMQCKIGSSQGMTKLMYFKEIASDRFMSVTRSLNEERDDADRVLDSINFSPTKEELESALIIP